MKKIDAVGLYIRLTVAITKLFPNTDVWKGLWAYYWKHIFPLAQ